MSDDAGTRRHEDAGMGDLSSGSTSGLPAAEGTPAHPGAPVSEGMSANEAQPDPASPLPRVPASALEWLDARAAPPPPELRARMAEALAGVTAETVPGALAEGALSCLRETLAAPEERASALDLLAADALLTYALEAAAELGAETLRRLTEEYGAGKLGSVLPPDEERGER